MRPSQYLISTGWRQVGFIHGAKLWDHPAHQPDSRGCFTTHDALNHQKQFERDKGCDCIKPQGVFCE